MSVGEFVPQRRFHFAVWVRGCKGKEDIYIGGGKRGEDGEAEARIRSSTYADTQAQAHVDA